MNEWPDASPPEWQQIQQMLHGTSRVRPRRQSARSRRLSFVAMAGIGAGLLLMALLVRDAWLGLIPYPVAGVGVLVAGLGCWALESWGQL
jgi:hypothetical protein